MPNAATKVKLVDPSPERRRRRPKAGGIGGRRVLLVAGQVSVERGVPNKRSRSQTAYVVRRTIVPGDAAEWAPAAVLQQRGADHIEWVLALARGRVLPEEHGVVKITVVRADMVQVCGVVAAVVGKLLGTPVGRERAHPVDRTVVAHFAALWVEAHTCHVHILLSEAGDYGL